MKSALTPPFQLNSVCTICDAKLPGLSQFESHYTSLRHLNNLLLHQKTLKEPASSSSFQQLLASGATMNAFDIPTVLQKPVKCSDKHFEIFNCDLCDMEISTTEEKTKHVKEFPHCNLVAMKTNLLSKGIDEQFYSLNITKKCIYCILCGIYMCSDQDCQLHLNGKRHLEKFNIWCSDQHMQFNNSNWSLDSTSAAKKYYTGAEHQSNGKPESVSSDPSGETLTCYVCRTSIMKSEKNEHVKNFPHADLAAIKTKLIKMGISKQFCFYSKKRDAIACNLCNVIMQLPQVVKSHLEGKRHMKNFNSWCAQQPVENLQSQSASKWYYCNVCTLDLDGTSDAAMHYQRKSHLKRLAKTPVEQPTKTKPDFKHLKLEGFVANLAQDNVIQNNLNLEETAEVKLPEFSIKTQIFNEIGKLVETLYFSKKVPYEVSLQHLKKINRDVEDIVKKHQQKRNIYSSCDISCDKPVSSEVKNSTMENDLFLVESKKQNFEIVNNSDETPLSETQPEAIIDNPTTVPEMLRIVSKEEFRDKFVSSQANDTTVEEFFLVETQDQSFETAHNSEDTPLDEKQPEAINDDSKTIPEMLRVVNKEEFRDKSVSSEVNDSTVKLVQPQDQSLKTTNNSEGTPLDEKQSEVIIDESKIVPEILRIVEIEKSRFQQNTSSLEVDILDEVEELLRQIEDPKAPFGEILKYLKTFNEVLEDLSVLEREII